MPEDKADHPYVDLPPRAYWRTAVSDVSPLVMADLYRPRFAIDTGMRITAAGSCFAQHISKEFKKRGFNFLDVEPAPPQMPAEAARNFGYGLYSARYGNVYSMRQLLQMFERAAGRFVPRERLWQSESRFFDPFRPSIEPGGFASAAEVERDIAYHLGCVASLLLQTDVFVFTFGLTEAWVDAEDGAVFPTCPGTVAGTFDATRHRFVNFTYPDVLADAEAFIALARRANPAMKFLFTVSPVPLTATASDSHVLPATVYSKSVLRAVCGDLVARHDGVDYFPSYEMVASHPFRASFFDPNLRTVAEPGVAHVMNTFFAAHGAKVPAKDGNALRRPPAARAVAKTADDDDVICDEEILETFG
jgi:hypothetical protein